MMAGLSDSSRFLPLTKSAYHHEKGLAHALRFDRTFMDLYYRSAGWSSLVARWAHNPKVGGSNPPPATKQVIECEAFACLPQALLCWSWAHLGTKFSDLRLDRTGHPTAQPVSDHRPQQRACIPSSSALQVHTKLLLFDNSDLEAELWVGSHNWTRQPWVA